jgi:hypothetical protein
MKINVLHVTILHRRLLKQLKQKCELFHSLHSSVIVCLICFWIIFEIKQMSYSFKFHPSKLYLLFTYLLRDLGLLPENFFNSDKFLLMFLELEIVKFKFCRRNLFACNGETSLEGTFFIRAQIYDNNFLCLSVTRLTIIGTVGPRCQLFWAYVLLIFWVFGTSYFYSRKITARKLHELHNTYKWENLSAGQKQDPKETIYFLTIAYINFFFQKFLFLVPNHLGIYISYFFVTVQR